MRPNFFDDLAAACRNLRRTPLFSLFICMLLAIALGANTVVYTLADKLLMRQLQVKQPGQLQRLGLRYSPVYTGYDHPYIYSKILKQRAKSFSEVFVSWPLEMSMNDGQQVETVLTETVSGNYFAAPGLAPKTGRLLSRDCECAHGRHHERTDSAALR